MESSYPSQSRSQVQGALMPEHDDHPEYLAPYIEALEASGPGFDATLWASPEGQVRRFDVLIELGDIAAHRILDVGCGPGDLAHRLVELNVPFTEYIGFDALEGMVVKAAGENLPRCRYEVVDVLAHPERMADVKPDIVVVSGTLNAMEEDLARELMAAAFDASAVGLVFNFLSNRPHPDRNTCVSPASRFDTVAWLDWAMERTPMVRFTQSYYQGHDATIAMFKDGG